MMLQRRFATLLEVLIALVLTVIVLTTLTFFYREISMLDNQIDKAKSEQFKLRYVENRLGTILPRAVSENAKSKDFVFFSINDEGVTLPGTQSLIFTYDNDISLDPPFSNHVLGRLFVDLDGRLTLMYWPSPKRWENEGSVPMKKEVLLENVDTLSFEFFAPQEQSSDLNDKSEEENEESSKPARGEMSSQQWKSDFNELPVMVKVTIGQKSADGNEKEEMVFVFPLANSKHHVIYQ